MFKTKEELFMNTNPYDAGIRKAFKSFAERVDKFKELSKFGAEPWKLRYDHEELYDRWKAYDHKHNWTNGSNRAYDIHYYYQWLFDYCFGDVIE